MPLTSAPTTGTKAPTKTRMPIALTSGRPRIAAPREMPIASTAATMIVARTKAVSETQALRPDESALSRACSGNNRTTQAQICWSLVEEEEQAEQRNEQPAMACVAVVPTSAARWPMPPPLITVSRSLLSESVMSFSVSPKLIRSRSRTCCTPSPTCADNLSNCCAICVPTRVSSPATSTIVATTVIPAAAPRGIRSFCRPFVTGTSRAVSRMPTVTGTTTSDRYRIP